MLQEIIKIVGTPTFTVYDETGQIKNQFTVKNMIVTTGKNWFTARMSGNASSVMTHIGLGDGTVATALTDTTLGGQIGRVAMNVAGGTVTGNKVNYTATFAPGVCTGTISEAGVFNASTGGTMLSRVVVAPFIKAAGDTVVVDWEIEVS